MNELQQSAPEMGIKDFLTVLRRRKWVIIPLMLLCLGAAIAWTLYTPKIWRAEAQLMLVQRAPTTSVSDNSSPPMIESMETEVGMIQSSAMAERTLAQLKNDALVQGQSSTSVTLDPQEIQEAVRVTNPIDSNLLDISADAPDRKDAARPGECGRSCVCPLEERHRAARHSGRGAEPPIPRRARRMMPCCWRSRR